MLNVKGDSVKNKPASAFVVPFGTSLSEIFPSQSCRPANRCRMAQNSSASSLIVLISVYRNEKKDKRKLIIRINKLLLRSRNQHISVDASILASQLAFFHNLIIKLLRLKEKYDSFIARPTGLWHE